MKRRHAGRHQTDAGIARDATAGRGYWSALAEMNDLAIMALVMVSQARHPWVPTP